MKIELNKKEINNLFYWINVAEEYIGSKEPFDKKEKLQNKKEINEVCNFRTKLNDLEESK